MSYIIRHWKDFLLLKAVYQDAQKSQTSYIYSLVDMASRLKDIKAAASRIHPYIHRTPVVTSSTLDKLVGRQCYFKCENFQKTGSFKVRGAVNTVSNFSALTHDIFCPFINFCVDTYIKYLTINK